MDPAELTGKDLMHLRNLTVKKTLKRRLKIYNRKTWAEKKSTLSGAENREGTTNLKAEEGGAYLLEAETMADAITAEERATT